VAGEAVIVSSKRCECVPPRRISELIYAGAILPEFGTAIRERSASSAASVRDALMEHGSVGRADDVPRALSVLDRRGFREWIFEGQLDKDGGPLPGPSLSTPIRPSCASTRCSTIANPRPKGMPGRTSPWRG
jgi:hypothetical protein